MAVASEAAGISSCICDGNCRADSVVWQHWSACTVAGRLMRLSNQVWAPGREWDCLASVWFKWSEATEDTVRAHEYQIGSKAESAQVLKSQLWESESTAQSLASQQAGRSQTE